MRIEPSFYGDYKVMDELPFTTQSLNSAIIKIGQQYGEVVNNWAVSTGYRNGFWNAWFIKPFPDQPRSSIQNGWPDISDEVIKAFYEL